MVNTIYILKNNVNTKVYIGQTWDTLEYRWRSGNGYKSCTHLQNAINKYGKDNFYYEILDTCEDQIEADKLEKFYIEKFDSINNGYNLMSGNSNGKHSKETKIKISVSKLGTVASEEARLNMSKAQTGRKQSEETKNKLSKIKSGKIPYEMTDEIRQKISELNTGAGNPFFRKHHTEETKNNLSNNNKLFDNDIEKEICNKYTSGYVLTKLSLEYKCSIDAIRACLIRNNIPRRSKGRKYNV